MNLQAMAPDAIIIRHAYSGAPHFLASRLKASIINAGTDCTSIRRRGCSTRTRSGEKEAPGGLKIAIVGDLMHSRVVRSNVHLLTKCGADVTVCGPVPYMPPQFAQMACARRTTSEGNHRRRRRHDAADPARAPGPRTLPLGREYFRFFGLDREKLKLAKPDCIVMHPGPMNRGVEIASDVADGPDSVILDQVTNGVAVRMAVLYLTIGGGHEETAA